MKMPDNVGDREVQKQLMQTIVDNEKEWREYIFTQVTEINAHLGRLNGRTAESEKKIESQCELCEERHKEENRPPTMTRIIITLTPIFLGLNVAMIFIITKLLEHADKVKAIIP